MARAQYQTRRMTEGPLLFILLIPFGAFFLLVGFDFFYKYYNEWKLLNDTKEVMDLMLNKEGLETHEDMKNYIKDQFYKMGYENVDDLSLVVGEDYYILVSYSSYFSMINEITFKPKKIAVARVKGFYNEYKEAVVEEYIPDETKEEDLIESGNSDIIIK